MEQLTAKAVQYSLYLLGRKNYTSRQLQDKLKKKDYSPAIIQAVLDKLNSWRYLDDDSFAESYIRERLRFKPRSRHILLRELKLKGIPQELAKEKIAKIMQEENLDDRGLAERTLQKKLGSYLKISAEKGAQRARNYLLRQGFSYEIADKLVRKYWKMKTAQNP
ncbi:MAG: regulatory protein RecX [bacterium]|nr:regulatory protein RecX [bacterium]MDD5354274.1 regulatory protein RecX [bacterium]MDD5757047.1 regulatory protein RecX [bacterium]